MDPITIQFAPDIITSYRRLNYKAWYALAELVDNSTQSYFENANALDKAYKDEGDRLRVEIAYSQGDSPVNDRITVNDNSMGMSLPEIERAFTLGQRPENTEGRSKYGLGLKTSAFWFGSDWSIKTKKLFEPTEYIVSVSLSKLRGGNLELDITEQEAKEEDHYTTVSIGQMNRRIAPRTIGKIKEYLSSMYRVDISERTMVLSWNGNPLTWEGYDADLIANNDGKPIKRLLDFKIGDHHVHGWIGVLGNGGRSKAGIALIQANRVIQGPPNAYKPTTLFGDQDGGPNDLVNQRLVGELHLDGFDVSHTKDAILWRDEEETEIERILLEEAGDLRQLATSYRKKAVDGRAPTDLDFDVAVKEIFEEIESPAFRNIKEALIPPEAVIHDRYSSVAETVIKNSYPWELVIDDLTISLFSDEDLSPNDPYVVSWSENDENAVVVIVNQHHPHWNEIEGSRGVLNFLRHCVYDGVSEWQAWKKHGKTMPDTIKFIKDQLLRIPFEIDRVQAVNGNGAAPVNGATDGGE